MNTQNHIANTENDKHRQHLKKKIKTAAIITIGLSLAGLVLLASCSNRHSQAKEIGILFCESEETWHGTIYDGGAQYPNSGQEVFWLVVCDGKAIVISNKQRNPVSTYTADNASVKTWTDVSGWGGLKWSLLLCEDKKTGHSFSSRAQYSANTKGAGIVSLLQRVDAMFAECAVPGSR